ncbi:MAG: nucleotide exchange factor GrpE [Lachnospiraceae bacterium]
MEENLNQETEQKEDVTVDTETENTEDISEETVQADAKTEENESEETAEEDSKEEKKSKKSKKKKDKRDEQIEELQDRVKRQMAEFDNFRKRTEKEKAQMFEVGAKSIIEKILPVVDNFERGLAAIPEEEQGSAFADGMNMIYKQLMTELEQAGVAPIEAVGKEFDPELHNAVMQVENDELESGTVAQELQKGYTYRESVVRHSMVAVVQ